MSPRRAASRRVDLSASRATSPTKLQRAEPDAPGRVHHRRRDHRPAATHRSFASCSRTCSATPGSSPARAPTARIEFGAIDEERHARLLRARQRRRLRHGLRRQAVRRVPAPAHAAGVPGHRHRPRDRAADRPAPRRPVWAEARVGKGATFYFTLAPLLLTEPAPLPPREA